MSLLEANRGKLGSHGGARDQVNNVNSKSIGGNSADYTKLRLKRDRPDLYEREAMRRGFLWAAHTEWGQLWGQLQI